MLSAQRCCKNQLDSRMLKLTHVPAEEMWHDTQLHETWRFIKATKKKLDEEDNEELHLDYLLMSKCLCILTNKFNASLNIGEPG